MLEVLTSTTKEAPVRHYVGQYEGQQYVGIDLHRRRSVVVRMTDAGELLEAVQITNSPLALAEVMTRAGEHPEVVLEATYGWYWATDTLAECGAVTHLAHPLGVKAFEYRRVKNDFRDSVDLADLLRMGRLPEAWIAPPGTRELRELVRHRALCRYRHKARYAEVRVMPRSGRRCWSGRWPASWGSTGGPWGTGSRLIGGLGRVATAG
jgi:Transposase